MIAGLLVAWYVGVNSFAGTLALGVILGFAGASFAIALPLASRWYPPEHQGKAMGIAGMGNSGTVLAALFAPMLAKAFGWNAVLGLACIPLAIVFVLYMLMAKDAPDQPAPKSLAAYLEPLKAADAWWFMLFYSVTFGGFVGLAASLSIYFTDSFGLTPVHRRLCTAACVFAGSLVRPLGGALADGIGGTEDTDRSSICVAGAGAGRSVSMGPPRCRAALTLFVIAMLALRLRQWRGVPARAAAVPQGDRGDDRSRRHGRRRRRLLPRLQSLGFAKQVTGSSAPGFLIFAGLAAVAFGAVTFVKGKWRSSWAANGVRI